MTLAHENDDINGARTERLAQQVRRFRDRLIFLCDDLAPERGKYAYLEKRTGISASKWQNLFLERQMPTIEMVMAILEHRRSYAKWLITGLPNVATWSEKAPAAMKDEVGKMQATIAAALGPDEAPDAAFWKRWLANREWIREKKSDGDNEG